MNGVSRSPGNRYIFGFASCGDHHQVASIHKLRFTDNARSKVMPFVDNDAAMVDERSSLDPEVISGLRVQVTKDSSEQRFDEKIAALRQALTMVSKRMGVAAMGRISPLPIYCGANVKCEATWNPEARGGARALFLGDRMMFQSNPVLQGQDRVYGVGQHGDRGVPDQLYDSKRMSVVNPARVVIGKAAYQARKTDAKVTAVIVHEIAHLLHEALSQDIFWRNKKTSADIVPANIAMQVSNYAANKNFDEFVAEVFTGLVHGKAYSPAVITVYQNYGGL
jgi:hypothetical protein